MGQQPLSKAIRKQIVAALKATEWRTTYALRKLKASGIIVAQGTVSSVKRQEKEAGRIPPEATKPGRGKLILQAVDPLDPILRADVLKRLRVRFTSVKHLAKLLHATPETITEVIDHVEHRGYNVLRDGDRVRICKEAPTGTIQRVRRSLLTGEVHRFGIIGDTHTCSHFERNDVIEDAYAEYKRQGITEVYHAGNMVDGEFKFNRFELYAHGVTDQCHYFLDHYPSVPGITTFLISGDCHEGWWQKDTGLNFGRYLQFEAEAAGRKDIRFIGHIEADVEFQGELGSSIMKIMHPGGGSAYAWSYAPQKIIESFQGGEKPAMLVCGHYHKAEYMCVRNVHSIQAGCTQDQTTFMRKRKLQAVVGYWVVEIELDINGAIRRCSPTFTTYYDRSYHIVHTAAPAKKKRSGKARR